jgi:hypothetical protein
VSFSLTELGFLCPMLIDERLKRAVYADFALGWRLFSQPKRTQKP